jgi:hypothetical protein
MTIIKNFQPEKKNRQMWNSDLRGARGSLIISGTPPCTWRWGDERARSDVHEKRQ